MKMWIEERIMMAGGGEGEKDGVTGGKGEKDGGQEEEDNND